MSRTLQDPRSRAIDAGVDAIYIWFLQDNITLPERDVLTIVRIVLDSAHNSGAIRYQQPGPNGWDPQP